MVVLGMNYGLILYRKAVTMIEALKDTMNPKGGHGMLDTIIFFVMVVALIAMSFMQIPIDPLFEKVITLLLGYVVGNNTKNPKTTEKTCNYVTEAETVKKMLDKEEGAESD